MNQLPCLSDKGMTILTFEDQNNKRKRARGEFSKKNIRMNKVNEIQNLRALIHISNFIILFWIYVK